MSKPKAAMPDRHKNNVDVIQDFEEVFQSFRDNQSEEEQRWYESQCLNLNPSVLKSVILKLILILVSANSSMSFLASHPKANSTEVDLSLRNIGKSFLNSTEKPTSPKKSNERRMSPLREEIVESLHPPGPEVASTIFSSNDSQSQTESNAVTIQKKSKRRSISDLLERYREVKNLSKVIDVKISVEGE